MAPLALAMLTCDGVFADAWTGKKTVLETFATIAVLELSMVLSEVVFPVSGEYRVQLLSGAELIIERRIMASVRPEA
jgi:hypothetical protein